MIEYVSLFMRGGDTKEVRKQILIDQYDQLEKKVEEMQESLRYLRHKIDKYEERILTYQRYLTPKE